MSRIIGAASEFYRLRVSRIDASDEPDLDWRDDILYRDPPTEVLDEEEDWRVEAVLLQEDRSVEIARFAEEDQAHSLGAVIQEDLDSMTKSAFDDRYMSDVVPGNPRSADESANTASEGSDATSGQ